MSITCFRIEVRGPESDLRALKEFLKPGIEILPEATFQNHMLRIDRLFPDLDREEHSFVWLDTGKWKQESIVEDECFSFAPDFTAMTILGECRWAPPVVLVPRLWKRFPNLTIKYGGTTEHELYEEWLCENGENKVLNACTTDFQTGTEFWHVKEGEVLDPAWAYRSKIE